MTLESLQALTRPWLVPALTAVALILGAAFAYRVSCKVMRRIARNMPVATELLRCGERPGMAVVILLVLGLIVRTAPADLPWMATVRHFLTLVLIGAIAWLAVRLISAIEKAVALRFPADVIDNLRARRIQTQTKVLTRFMMSMAVLIAIAFGLLTFPGVRDIGASLLASAGIFGIVLGIAAKPILGNLLAGLQIALTQPIRLDDVVVIEGECGRVEEITRAFVVVGLWDHRRLVVPLEYFIQKPFQNWTRKSSRILGTVYFWVDYGMPVDPLRREVRRICESSSEWDGRVCVLQVSDAAQNAKQLRVLVSSTDAAMNWDLRCEVRERLISYMLREYPAFIGHLHPDLVGHETLAQESRKAPQREGAKIPERESMRTAPSS